jgi:hypothetical protein
MLMTPSLRGVSFLFIYMFGVHMLAFTYFRQSVSIHHPFWLQHIEKGVDSSRWTTALELFIVCIGRKRPDDTKDYTAVKTTRKERRA